MKTITLKKAAKKVRKGAQIENDLPDNKERLIEVLKFIFPKDGYNYERDLFGGLNRVGYRSQTGCKRWVWLKVLNYDLPIIKLSSIVDKTKWKKEIEERLKAVESELKNKVDHAVYDLTVFESDNRTELVSDLYISNQGSQPKEQEDVFVLPEKYAVKANDITKQYIEEIIKHKHRIDLEIQLGNFLLSDGKYFYQCNTTNPNGFDQHDIISGVQFLTHVYEPWKASQKFVVPEKFAFRLDCDEAVEYANSNKITKETYYESNHLFHYPASNYLGENCHERGKLQEGYTDVTEQFIEHIYKPWKKQQEVKLNFEPEKKAESSISFAEETEEIDWDKHQLMESSVNARLEGVLTDSQLQYLSDDMYLPIHYRGIKVAQPFYSGDGNHSVAQLEEICRQYKEYAHQQAVIKENCMKHIIELKFSVEFPQNDC